MIPPHLFYQIYLSVLEQNDCTDSAHTEVEDLSSRYVNGSISRSSQCSTTSVTKAVVCVILSVGWCI